MVVCLKIWKSTMSKVKILRSKYLTYRFSNLILDSIDLSNFPYFEIVFRLYCSSFFCCLLLINNVRRLFSCTLISRLCNFFILTSFYWTWIFQPKWPLVTMWPRCNYLHPLMCVLGIVQAQNNILSINIFYWRRVEETILWLMYFFFFI